MTFETFQKKLPITYRQPNKSNKFYTAHLPTLQIAVVSAVAGNNFLITFENICTETKIVGSVFEADKHIRLVAAQFFVESLHTIKEDSYANRV